MYTLLEQRSPIFLDRDQGDKIIPEILRQAGLKVECHSQYFSREELDDVWIRECATKGWVIFTADKGIETDPPNKTAVIESKAKVFILQDNGAKAIYWAAAILVSRRRIYEIVHEHEGPFYVSLSRETGYLARDIRIPSPHAKEAPKLHSSELPPALPGEQSD